MLGFVLAILGLGYTIGKIGVEFTRNKASDVRYNNAKRQRDAFVEPIMASEALMTAMRNNTDYSDVVDDLEYIFNQKYSSDYIKLLLTRTRGELGNEKGYRDLVMELRLAKIGKCCYSTTKGIRFCDNSSYVDEMKRYFGVLQKHFAENGIYVEPVVKSRTSNNIVKEMYFKEFRTQW